MKRVKFLIRRKKESRVASPKAVGKLRKREAVAKKSERDVRVVQ